MSNDLFTASIAIKPNAGPIDEKIAKVKQDLKNIPEKEVTIDAKIKGNLEELKAQFGRRSGVGELGETLMGAGAVAGIGIALEGLNKLTEKAAELADRFREGKVSAGEMGLEIAESIPLLGLLVEAGENLVEAFTGAKAAVESGIEADERYLDVLKQIASAESDMAKLREANVNKLNSINNQIMASQLTTGKTGAARGEGAIEGQFQAAGGDIELAMVQQAAAIRRKSSEQDLDDWQKIYNLQMDSVKNKSNYDEDAQNIAHIQWEQKRRHGNENEDIDKVHENAKQQLDDDKKLRDQRLKDLHDVSAVQAQLDQEHLQLSAKTFDQRVAAYKTQLQLEKGGNVTPEQQKGIDKATDTFAQNLALKEQNSLIDEQRGLQAQILAAKKPIGSLDTAEIEALKAQEPLWDKKTQALIEWQITLEKQLELAQRQKQLAQDMQNVDNEAADSGKSSIDQQISAFDRKAKLAGETDAQIQAQNEHLREQSSLIKANNNIKSLNDQASEVGLSAPDKAVQNLKNQGVTDPALLARDWQAAAKLAGKELQSSLENPLEKWKKEMSDLDQLKASGSIDQQTYNRARNKYNQELGSTGGQSIEDRFANQLTGTMLMRAGGTRQQSVGEKQYTEAVRQTSLLSQALSVWKSIQKANPKAPMSALGR